MTLRPLAEVIEPEGGLIQTGPFGSQLHQHEYQEEGVPVVMPKDIDGGVVSVSSIARISQEKANRLSRHKLHKGDIVFPRRGEISKCALIREHEEGFLCGTGCLKIVVPDSAYSSAFLHYYLRLPFAVGWLVNHAVGTTMLNLNTSILGALPVPDTDRQIQDKIVGVTRTYDDLIENNRRRIKLLDEAARLIYREWFVRLRFPGHAHTKIVDGVPEGWTKGFAIDALDVQSGGTPKTDNPEFWDGGIPFFTPKDASNSLYVMETEKTITESGLRACNSRLYERDTVFITARGTVGKLSLASEPMAMNQSCYALIAKPPLNQHFLMLALQSAVEQFRAHAGGAVFNAIVVDTFRRIPFVIPARDSVEAFTEIVSPMLNQIDVLLKQSASLKKARDLLLPRLMSGEIEV